MEFSLPVNWNDTTVCEYFLEQRCALLASDYLRAATEGSDASHLTMDLTMAHAELIYWRGFETVQAEAEPHLKAMLSPIHTLVGRNPGFSAQVPPDTLPYSSALAP